MTVTDTTPLADLEALTKTIRRDIINSTTTAGSGHPTSSMSAVELTVPLYFAGILRYDPKNPHWPERDRFILSKGHAAPLLYALLAEAGYFSTDLLPTLRKLGSPLEGHPNMRRCPGVEASTGSLGQGLSLGVGMALAAKLDGRDSRIYVLMGDGEVEEGQVWEAVMAGNKFHLDNLVAIVDQNGYQQTGPTSKVMNLRPLAEKFEAFGWFVQEIDGHDLGAVIGAYATARATKGRPTAIVAYTKKGYPIMDVIHDPNHHGKALTPEEAKRAIAFIDSYDPQLQRDKDKD
ncbi:MAG TPA: transketolase [Gemmataceae bacterium]|nr:transketolase [Gemmataceae bacterium]